MGYVSCDSSTTTASTRSTVATVQSYVKQRSGSVTNESGDANSRAGVAALHFKTNDVSVLKCPSLFVSSFYYVLASSLSSVSCMTKGSTSCAELDAECFCPAGAMRMNGSAKDHTHSVHRFHASCACTAAGNHAIQHLCSCLRRRLTTSIGRSPLRSCARRASRQWHRIAAPAVASKDGAVPYGDVFRDDSL
eukprot:349587-Pleurochrysis_carterae.AAC.1